MNVLPSVAVRHEMCITTMCVYLGIFNRATLVSELVERGEKMLRNGLQLPNSNPSKLNDSICAQLCDAGLEALARATRYSSPFYKPLAKIHIYTFGWLICCWSYKHCMWHFSQILLWEKSWSYTNPAPWGDLRCCKTWDRMILLLTGYTETGL